MNRFRKHIAAAVLLALTVLPLLYAAWLSVKQVQVQQTMQEQLENTALQTITLPTTSLHWAKAGKELLIDGHLFDVKKITYTANYITVTGLFDKAETAIKKIINNHHHQPDAAQLTALQFLLLPFFSNTECISFCHLLAPAQPLTDLAFCKTIKYPAAVPVPPPDYMRL